MKINKPSEATGKVYCRDVGEDVWSKLEQVGKCLRDDFDDEPTNEGWGEQYEVEVTVRKIP